MRPPKTTGEFRARTQKNKMDKIDGSGFEKDPLSIRNEWKSAREPTWIECVQRV